MSERGTWKQAIERMRNEEALQHDPTYQPEEEYLRFAGINLEADKEQLAKLKGGLEERVARLTRALLRAYDYIADLHEYVAWVEGRVDELEQCFEGVADDEQGREALQETVDILSRSRDRGYRLLREARSILDAWEGMNEFGDIIDNDDVRIISNRVLAWKKALAAYEWGERE